MNRSDSETRSSDAISSEISNLRSRMDETIDAISNRLKGRHLADEVLGLIRSRDGGRPLRDRISDSGGAAVHAVVDAVKEHPMPSLLIGAGLAWFAYEKEERKRVGTHPDPTGEESDTGAHLKEKAGEVRDRLAHKSAQARARTREGVERAREGLVEAGIETRERARELASRTGARVRRTARERPLETGLSCLALGMLAAFAIPTPETVREAVEPTSRRIRRRAEEVASDLVEKGKSVAHAASKAAQDEAEAQGLTPEQMAGKRHEATRDEPVSPPAPTGRPSADVEHPGPRGEPRPDPSAGREATPGARPRTTP